MRVSHRLVGLVSIGCYASAAALLCAAGPAVNRSHPNPVMLPQVFMMTAAPATGGTSLLEGCDLPNPQVQVCLHPCDGTSGDHWHAEAVHVVSNMPSSCPDLGTTTLSVDPLPAGTYDVAIGNLGDSNAPVAHSLFHVSSQKTPQVIFGTHLRQELRFDDAITNASGISEVPDRSGNSNIVTQTSASNEAQLNPNNPNFNHHKTGSFTASGSQYLDMPSPMSMSGSQTGFYVFGAWSLTTKSGVGLCYNDGSHNYSVQPTNAATTTSFQYGTSLITFSSIDTFGMGNIFSGGITSSQGTLSIDNVTAVTGSSSLSIPSTITAARIGTSCSVDSFISGDIAEIDVVDVVPTTQQSLDMAQYLNNTFQPYTPPTISATTNVGADTSNTGFRFLAQNLLPGFTGSILVGGTSYPLTCDQIDTEHGECCSGVPSVPVGTSNTFTIVGADSNTTSWNDVPFVQPSTDPVSSEACGCAGWWQNSALAASGGSPNTGDKISELFDLSYNSNDATNATSSSQPVWNTSDPSFSGAPSFTFNGTNGFIGVFPPRLTSPSTIAFAGVCKQTTTSGNRIPISVSIGGADYVIYTSGVPQMHGNGTTVSYGSSVSGANGFIGRGTSSNLLGILINGGTEQSTSYTFATGTGGNLVLGAFPNTGADYWSGACSGIALFTQSPNASNIHAWQQSIGAP